MARLCGFGMGGGLAGLIQGWEQRAASREADRASSSIRSDRRPFGDHDTSSIVGGWFDAEGDQAQFDCQALPRECQHVPDLLDETLGPRLSQKISAIS